MVLCAVAGATACSDDGSGSSSAGATSEGGVLLFMRQDSHQLWKPWVACPDMSHARELPTRDGHNAGWGVWSPDGTRIAFNADYDDPDLTDRTAIWDIYTMNPDGSDVTKLTHSVGLEGDPGYSPDGKLLAFDSAEPGRQGIWVMNAQDGSDERLVSATPPGFEPDFGPRFSPDGTKIVFARGQAFAGLSWGLWTVNLDGTGLTQITPPDMSPAKPAWSPDGSTIVFDAYTADYPYQNVWTIHPDGTGLTALDLPAGTEGDPEGYADPTWSPDGKTIIVGHGQHQGTDSATVSFATLRPDGTGLDWVKDGSSDEHRPEWGTGTC